MTSLLIFFLATFAVTWTFWSAAKAVANGVVPADPASGLGGVLLLAGTYAPAFVALALTARAGGREAVLALLRRLLQWEVRLRWYVFAVGYVAAVKLTVALVHRVVAGAWPRFGDDWYLITGVLGTMAFFWGQAGEEIGWRGYALPRLAARIGLGPASVALGVIWAVWHLPLFFFPGADTEGQSFPVYLLQVTALSVAIAWLYAQTKGSLLLVMLLHSAVNNTKDIVPSAVPGASNPFALSTSLVAWLTVALFWICAVYFLARMPRMERGGPEHRPTVAAASGSPL